MANQLLKFYLGMLDSKRCKTCQNEKALCEFPKGKGNAGGLRPNCKSCSYATERQRTVERRELSKQKTAAKKNAKRLATSQVCSGCGSLKTISEFPPDKRVLIGVAKRCRSCVNDRGKRHAALKRSIDPEACRARARIVYWRKPDHYRSYGAAKQRERFAKNPEKVRETVRAAYKANPFRMREAARKRRAALAKATGAGLTEAQWSEILEINDNRCAYCLERSDSLEVDHVIALARGGSHDAQNVVPACETCNTSKNDKSLLEIFEPRLLIEQRRTVAVR